MNEMKELERLQDLLECSFHDARLYRSALKEAQVKEESLGEVELLAPLVYSPGHEGPALRAALQASHRGEVSYLEGSEEEARAEYELRRRILAAGFASRLKPALFTLV